MKKKILSFVLALAMVLGVMPFSAFAAPGDYSSGKDDTASYVLDVSAADEYSTIIKYSEGHDFEIVESNGESFLSCKPRVNWTNHSYDPWARIYTYENTYGGFTDPESVNLSAINYFAWRIKIPAGETPIAFSLFMEHDLYSEIFNTGACTFIDNKTREVSTAITPGYGRGKAVLVNAGEGFDGWMILDLNQDFINGYTHGDIPQKDFFLGIVDEGVERTAANSFTGVFHLTFHRNACTHVELDGSFETDFANREVLFGDAFIVEDIDAFKAVRLSCEEAGHVLEPTDAVTPPDCDDQGYTIMQCKFCEHTEQGNFVDPTGHTWVEDHREEASCTEPEKIYVSCACGATDVQEGEAARGHEMDTLDYKEPTCKEPGYLEEECIYCGEYSWKDLDSAHKYEDGACVWCGEADPNALPKHETEDEHEWEIVSEEPATCQVPNKIHYTCICGATKTEDGETVDHDMQPKGIGTPATCVAAGSHEEFCSYECGKIETVIDEINPDAHSFKAGTCTLCGAPNLVSYVTGKGDTARYALDVSAADEYSTVIKHSEGYDFEIVESNGESFLKAKPRDSWLNYDYDPWARLYTYENTFGGFTDDGAIDLSAINYFAWRIKVPAGEKSFSFSIYMEHNLYSEILDLSKATFIDYATREVSTSVTAGYGGSRAMLVNANEGFDGWMILDLNQDFINSYTHGDIPHKDFFLGIVDEGVERTASNSFTGVFHIETHRNACTHVGGASYESSYADREILFGDALLVEDLDTFKEVRFSCDEAGHVYEDGACKFCGEIEEIPVPPVENPTLIVNSATANSITVSWNAVDGVNSYFVQVADKATGAVVKTVHAVDATTATIYGLTGGTEYTVAICSHIPGRPVAYAAPVDAATVGYASLGLTATKDGNFAILNWTKPANAVEYYVYILDGDEIVKVARVANADQTTFTFVLPLDAGTYSFGIIAVTEGNVYEPMQKSADQIVVSEFANPTPVIGAATAKTINVSWNAVDGVSEYYVRVIDKATGAVVKTVRVVGATETTVYGLTANTEYEISICAYSVGRPATYSDAVDAATIDYAALALNVTVNGKEATFSWTKPADAVAYYLYVLRGDETVKVAGVQDPNATSFVLWVPDAEGCTFGIIAATDSGAGVVYSPMQYAAN